MFKTRLHVLQGMTYTILYCTVAMNELGLSVYYTVATRMIYPVGNRLGRVVYHSLLSIAEAKNDGAVPQFPHTS
jgi:hypothetical protein